MVVFYVFQAITYELEKKGDGQAIHTGEEKGMGLWLNAINKHSEWKAVASQQFNGASFDQYVKNKLYLSTSIRHNFINVSPLVESILEGDIEKAKIAYKEINKQGYFIDMVRQFDYLPELAKRLKERRTLLKKEPYKRTC